MPGVFDSDPLHLISVHQLAQGSIYAISDSTEGSAVLRPGISGGAAKGSLQLDRVLLQFFFEGRGPIVAVPYQQTSSASVNAGTGAVS